MKFTIDVTLDDEKAAEVEPAALDKYFPEPNAHALADQLHEWLCDADGIPDWVYTVDSCEPAR